ncbi:hypothetical protein DSO57_1019489 [Entomophthora muscae]|uniref:Uncharacterized protein n=1 Tax=Entomophthora muscae TaxID=34485 RepID=A0ACC2U2N9_9FUNG|nr:hypothetical protein DSO57_1019489 [Entomophthora muscae]
MSKENTESVSLLRSLFELTKPYDKYISFAIILIWIYIRSHIKAKEIKKQRELENSKTSLVEEKSMLDKYFPKAKPFHPSDVLVKTEPEAEAEIAPASDPEKEDSDIFLVENPGTESQIKDAGAKKSE